MRYISTHNPNNTVPLSEAIGKCITCEGGLFLPGHIPTIPRAFFNNIEEMNLREIAYVVMSLFFGDDIAPSELKKITDETFSFQIPLRNLSDSRHILELYHGPTLTFKDFGARFMARLLHAVDSGSGRRRNVLVATSGNTGAATVSGFRNIEGISVHVLFPKGALSRLQEAQLTSQGGNIHAIEVAGSVDDCTSLVRNAIADRTLAESLSLTGAGSINVARLLPQIVFFFQAYARMRQAGLAAADASDYFIPAGNLSNIVAAVMAKRCGLPMGRIVAACGVRNELCSITGTDVSHTDLKPISSAPSLNMTKASNLPRLLHLFGDDIEAMKKEIEVCPVTDTVIADAVNGYVSRYGFLPDPHTGAACLAADHRMNDKTPAVILATGHPAKSLDAMTRITGRAVELPVQLTRFMTPGRNSIQLPPTMPALKKALISTTV